tara:strand:+ start:509 stop:952 length:444 start_codon:yes stop_codon:yes gene_type:complete
MIISCNSCKRKFEIDPKLIPENGRLLQCGVCNHHWFFKIKTELKESLKVIEKTKKNSSEVFDKNIDKFEDKIPDISNKKEIIKADSSSKNSLINIIIVFIISSIALIILLDTFKAPIGIVVPDIELILYNLYETINDILLFFKDLIR